MSSLIIYKLFQRAPPAGILLQFLY
jgi:hypothetical protein